MPFENQDILPLLDDLLPRGRGLLVMLKVFLDLGEKRHAGDVVMCVASVIFKPTPYKQFVRPWNRMLKTWGASAFHATDFYNGAAEFKRNTPERMLLHDKDSKRIPRMIGEHVQRITIISFRPEEFKQIASPQWKAKFGTSVHSHAVQLSLIANGWWRKDKCPSESFAYVMETGDTDEGEVLRDIEKMRHDIGTGTASAIAVTSFTTVDKGKARGLEAADFVAWQWNKYYIDKIRTGQDFNPRKDLAALVDASNEQIEYILATGETLKYLFSLVPPEILEGQNGEKTKSAGI